MSKLGMFAKFMGATALTSAAAAPLVAAEDGAPANEVTAEQVEEALAAAHADGVTEGTKAGTEAGATAERARTSAVLSSDAGKANFSMAAFMLSSNPTATADSIIAHLDTLPKSAVAPTGEKTAEAPAVTTPLAQTPLVPLSGAADAASKDASSESDTDKLWAEARTSLDKPGNVTTGGTSAFRPTGN